MPATTTSRVFDLTTGLDAEAMPDRAGTFGDIVKQAQNLEAAGVVAIENVSTPRGDVLVGILDREAVLQDPEATLSTLQQCGVTRRYPGALSSDQLVQMTEECPGEVFALNEGVGGSDYHQDVFDQALAIRATLTLPDSSPFMIRTAGERNIAAIYPDSTYDDYETQRWAQKG